MPLFFYARRPIEATIDIALLTGITGYLTYIWGQVDIVAGWAMVSYCAWLGFATYLSVRPHRSISVSLAYILRLVWDISTTGIWPTRSATHLHQRRVRQPDMWMKLQGRTERVSSRNPWYDAVYQGWDLYHDCTLLDFQDGRGMVYLLDWSMFTI